MSDLAPHGTSARYSSECRCAPCTEAQRLYQQDYRRRRAERGESQASKTVAWKKLANCEGMDPSSFFPLDDDTAAIKEAKAVCRDCKVRDACLTYAESWPHENEGIWGGLSESDRRRLRNRKKRSA